MKKIIVIIVNVIIIAAMLIFVILYSRFESTDSYRRQVDHFEKEHICCAISNNKDVQVSSKKAWLAERFDDGLVFLKSVERGKCFIEYIPAENAWVPIEAAGYMYIDCLWVSGSLKGHGYSSDLLRECIRDSKEKARNALTPVTTYALFHDGEYITNEQMNDRKFLKLAGK